MTETHRLLQFDDELPKVEVVSRLAAAVLNGLAEKRRSVTDYRRMGPLTISWTDDGGVKHSRTIRFAELVGLMRISRVFPFERPGLKKPLSKWLDGSIWITKPDAPIVAVDGSHHLPFELITEFGDRFPLKPAIDREGVAMSSLQLHVQTEIVRLHRECVEGPASPVDLDGTWFATFRSLLRECISILDMTLHQLYYMAKYRGSELGWAFDERELEKRPGQRLKDKFGWIGKITGRDLDNAEEEIRDFVILKDLRNHLDHFDPPCFAFHVEEAAEWLNLVPSIGRLLWKIREKLETPLSAELTAIILLPDVLFIPRDPAARRAPRDPSSGIGSVRGEV